MDEVAHYADFSLFERTAESDEVETVPGKTREECVNACDLEESNSWYVIKHEALFTWPPF